MWVSVFSYLRTLTTRHCPHSSAACRCCSSQSISPTRRAHSSEPAALWDRQTDGHRTVSLTLLRILRRQYRRMPEIVGARMADGINVQKIITDVNNRVYYGKNNERQQTLMINVDVFFQTVCELRIEYFCSSCIFEIPVGSSCSSRRNSFPNSYYEIHSEKA